MEEVHQRAGQQQQVDPVAGDMAPVLAQHVKPCDQCSRRQRHAGWAPPEGVSLNSLTGLQAVLDGLCDISSRDALTGLANRRQFEVAISREIDRVARAGEPALLLVLDIDHFKRINDQYGHMVGDTVLKNLSLFCQHKLRDIDVFGRFGGEEFLIACPETDAKAAFEIAERLREAISKDYFAIVNGKEITLTVSIGISIFDPKQVNHDSLDLAMDLYIDYSDKAMYCAKNAGRNQVKLFDEGMIS